MSRRFGRSLWIAGSLAAIGALVGVMVALAASGDLDATFSGDGKVTTDFGSSWADSAYGVALQSNGKIVAVGDRADPAHSTASSRNFALARYNSNGTLDSTFSGDGRQLTDFGAVDSALDVAIQADGKIVVAGQTCDASLPNWVCQVAVARYNTSGALDTTFSGDGKQVLASGAGDARQGGLAIQTDGKIVVGGSMLNASGNRDFAVYRLNPGGALDSTFSGDGKMNIGFGSGWADGGTDLLLSGGKIIVAGVTYGASGSADFALARLTSSGALDTTFSGDGKQVTDFGADETAIAVALQPDGKIVLTGQKHAGSAFYFALARYSTNGALDTTFSGDGRQTIGFGTYNVAQDVLVQADGKIVVAGTVLGNASYDFALARFNANGSLDTMFSGDGRATFGFGNPSSEQARALVKQGDGKYVLAGSALLATNNLNFGLMRVLP